MKSVITLAVSAALAATAFSDLASAQSAVNRGQPSAMQGLSQNRDKPVHIEAASLEVRDKERRATFTGNVHVVQGDTTMRCKILVVHYDGSAPPGGGMKAATPGPSGQQQISRLEAKGDVVVTQHDQTATGDLGLFDVKSNTITLTGNVVVSQGKNVVRGERLVVDMTTGFSRMDGGSKGRTQMLIDQKDGTATMKSGPFSR